MRATVTLLLVAGSAVLTGYAVSTLPFYEEKDDPFAELVLITAALWVLFALAVIALRRVPAKRVAVVVLVGSIAIGGASLLGPPNTSTDSARYAWDGIVQNAGISPYAYVPADPALEELRTDWLFPPLSSDADGNPTCSGERIVGGRDVGTDDPFCTAINRALVPTIYPPLAELFFAGIRLLVGPDAEYWPLQLAGFAMSVGITAMLLRILRRRDLDTRWAALWGWCPLVATEGITNSHVDLLAGLLVLVATVLVADGRRWSGGIAIGAAIAVKLIPVIAAPALLRRQPWKIVLAAVGTFAVLYIPYVATTGIAVLGYLPGYLTEEGFDTGDRFVLFSPIAPGQGSLLIVAVILAVTAGLVWWRTNPDAPWLGQLVMIGVTLMVVTPRYPWYALLLVPFVAMTGRWEWLTVALVITQRLLLPFPGLTRTTMTIAIVFVIAVSIARLGAHRRRDIRRGIRRRIHNLRIRGK